MSKDTLNLAVGVTVQVQLTLPPDSPREMVRVIGYLPGGSLVVTTPSRNGNFRIVREGQTYKVRMLRGDSVVGFESKVLASALKPYPHLHLQYPKDFEQIVVRNSARVKTDMPCMIRNTHKPDSPEHHHQARIVDLSETGAKVAAPISLGAANDMLQVGMKLDVLGTEEQLVLVGDLRSVRERLEKDKNGKRTGHYLHGVQFKAVNRFQQVLLHAWVLERLVSGAGDLG